MSQKLLLLTENDWSVRPNLLSGPFPQDGKYLEVGVYQFPCSRDEVMDLNDKSSAINGLIRQLTTPANSRIDVIDKRAFVDRRTCKEIITEVISAKGGIFAEYLDRLPEEFRFKETRSQNYSVGLFSISQMESLVDYLGRFK